MEVYNTYDPSQMVRKTGKQEKAKEIAEFGVHILWTLSERLKSILQFNELNMIGL
jgi:hypothetical protein